MKKIILLIFSLCFTFTVMAVETVKLVVTDPPIACGSVNITAESITAGSTADLTYTYWTDPAATVAYATPETASAGTYYIKGTSTLGAYDIQPVTVTVNPVPTLYITTSASNLNCNVNSMVLTAHATPSNVSYNWSNGSTGSTTAVNTGGTYSLTVTAPSGCTATNQISIVKYDLPVITVNASPSTTFTCQVSSIRLTAFANGGRTPYTYSIDGVNFQTESYFDFTVAGSYTIYVKDANGCLAENDMIIGEDKIPSVITLTANTPVINCLTPNASLNVSSPTAKTITWNDGSTLLNRTVSHGGTYTVTTVGFNGCISTQSVTIMEDETVPTLNITTSASNLNCNVSYIVLTAHATPSNVSYNWSNGSTGSTTSVNTAGTYSVTVTAPSGCTATDQISIVQYGLPVISIVVSPWSIFNCNVSSIHITEYAAGGKSPYTYSIDGVNYQTDNYFDVTTAGIYKLHVKDANGCMSDNDIILGENKTPPAITSLTSSASILSCSITEANLSVSSPTAKSILWNDGSTLLEHIVNVSGTYTVTATGYNGCTNTASIDILDDEEKPTVNITSSASDLNCNVSDILLTAHATPSDVSYNWTNGSPASTTTVDTEGMYFVTVTDLSGCSTTNRINIVKYGLPVVSLVSSPASRFTCQVSSIRLKAYVNDAKEPYTYSIDGVNYQIDNYFDITSAGVYPIYVKDANNCMSDGGIVIVDDRIIPTFTAVANQPSSDGEQGSITLSKDASDTYYINDVPNGSLIDLSAGDYSLKVENTEGCESDIQILTINNGTGLSETTAAAINIYPNPVGDAFQITGIENKATIAISDINGKLQLTKEVVNNEPISVNHLASGIYTVKISTAEIVVEKKIVKK